MKKPCLIILIIAITILSAGCRVLNEDTINRWTGEHGDYLEWSLGEYTVIEIARWDTLLDPMTVLMQDGLPQLTYELQIEFYHEDGRKFTLKTGNPLEKAIVHKCRDILEDEIEKIPIIKLPGNNEFTHATYSSDDEEMIPITDSSIEFFGSSYFIVNVRDEDESIIIKLNTGIRLYDLNLQNLSENHLSGYIQNWFITEEADMAEFEQYIRDVAPIALTHYSQYIDSDSIILTFDLKCTDCTKWHNSLHGSDVNP